jgi:hypothetical protein
MKITFQWQSRMTKESGEQPRPLTLVTEKALRG